MPPVTRYAKSGDVHIAYQVFGDGPADIVLVPGFVSHIENYWDEPSVARWLNRLGSFARIVMFDKRGTGLSDRVHPLPDIETRMDDVRAVMDAVALDKAHVVGISEGGPMSVVFAGTYPDRCHSLTLYGTFARFRDTIMTDAELQEFLDHIDTDWGTGNTLYRFAPSRRKDPAFKQWWGRFERLGASPADAISVMQTSQEIDISDILPSIHVPTLVIHRTEDIGVNVEGGRQLAKGIPGARLVELPGRDHLAWTGENADEIVDVIEEFVTGSTSARIPDRVLATVLFTDIVSSTTKAETMGDRRWGDLLETHNTMVRRELARYRGQEVKTLGDGFLATFDGPARAIRCALAINESVRALGIDLRSGLHTGEVVLSENDVSGIAVHIASRVIDNAQPGEVLVSRTVHDLVAGSGLNFAERGAQTLEGFAETMRLYAAQK